MNGSTSSRVGGFLAGLLVSAAVSITASSGAIAAAGTCSDMKTLARKDLTVQTADMVPASSTLPAFCKIRGQIAGKIGFEARLPAADWNGALFMAGCGGFCGTLLPDKPGFSNSILPALKKGYAVITTDGGHKGQNHKTGWAYDDPEALEIFAHKLLPLTIQGLEELTHSFYQKPAHRKLYSGCSNGGRLGLVAAQRYPELFDGILVGGPILDMTGNAGIHGAWLSRSNTTPDGDRILTPRTAALLQKEILAQCDALDGQKDGLISRPGRCKPDLDKLSCNARTVLPCLTSDEIAAAWKLYQGAQDKDGRPLFFGIAPGGEHNWPLWITGDENRPGWGQRAGENYLKLAAHLLNVPDLKAPTFDFNRHPAVLTHSSLPDLLDATDTDLSAFRKNGGKLLLWHGWADSLILPQRTVQYYEQVTTRDGSMEITQTYFRMFMVPGHGHCWGVPGTGPDLFDPIATLEDWLERDQAPDTLNAVQKSGKGDVIRSRPICAYPKTATLIQGRNPDLSMSYRCE